MVGHGIRYVYGTGQFRSRPSGEYFTQADGAGFLYAFLSRIDLDTYPSSGAQQQTIATLAYTEGNNVDGCGEATLRPELATVTNEDGAVLTFGYTSATLTAPYCPSGHVEGLSSVTLTNHGQTTSVVTLAYASGAAGFVSSATYPTNEVEQYSSASAGKNYWSVGYAVPSTGAADESFVQNIFDSDGNLTETKGPYQCLGSA